MTPAGPVKLRIGRVTSREDVPAIAALQARTFVVPWGIDAIVWELEHSDVSRLYAAHLSGRDDVPERAVRDRTEEAMATDEELVAYCATWLLFDELHINSLAVAGAWRRRHVARRLLAHIFSDVVGAGATKATLEVRQSNEAARRLYEGLGFGVEAVRRDYYQHPREDALVLWSRDLIAASDRLARL